MKRFLTFFPIACVLFSALILTSCLESESTNLSDSGDALDKTCSNEEEDAEGNDLAIAGDTLSEDSSPDKTAGSSGNPESPENIENDVMFYNSEVNFAFIYPQGNLVISSLPGCVEENGSDLLLNVSIEHIDNLIGPDSEEAINEKEALEAGESGSYPDYSFGPSRKLIKVSDTYVKDFLILSGYGNTPCDITFDRKLRFYNNNYLVEILLSANKDKIMDSMEEYFTDKRTDCTGKKVWGLLKQDEFYEKLIARQAPAPAQEWYDAFEDIAYLLQINDFKGATGGYSRLIDKRIFEENTGENYLISVSYPQFQSATAGGLDETINKIIYEQKILSIINDFKEEISSYEDEGLDPDYYLSIDYSVYTYNENGISLCFEIYPYLGGAHGLQYFETVNFDPGKMSTVEIGELFISSYDYYSSISEHCRESLKSQISKRGFEPDMQLVSNGTDPYYADNFKNFLLSPNGLIIKFPAYQVAPYAAGSFTVNIPYEEFGNNLNTESIIFPFLNR
jgi:hypothetical protein